MSIIEDYLREVNATLRVSGPRKRQIVDELRSHIEERVREKSAERPDAWRSDVEREVLNDMGSPRDLALAYEPDGSTLVKSRVTGETILRVGAAVGRGAGKVLKWVAIVTAIVLVVAIGLGIWAYYELKPYALAFAEQAEPIYTYDQECTGTPCNGALPADTFFVANATKEVRFELQLFHARDPDSGAAIGNGSVTILVQDPDGVARMNRTLSVTNASSTTSEQTWSAIPGNWTVAVRYDGFVGEIRLEGHARIVDLQDRR